MNRKIKISIFVIVACFFATTVSAQFSKNEANNLVLNTILAGDIGKVDVYSSINSKSGSIDLINNESISCAYANNYVYFINDMPYSAWGHSCRYIFVNSQTGVYSIVTDDIYPKNQDSDFLLLSEANHPIASNFSSITATNTLQANDHLKAVIVCLQDNQTNWNDISLVYNTLIQKYGYTKDNIIVHYGKYGTSNTLYGNDLDDDGSDDIDYSAFGSAIHATFNELAGNTNANPNIVPLEADDQLSVFFTDVYVMFPQPEINIWGFWSDGGGGPYIDIEDPTEIANIIDDINCAQLTLTFSINSAKGVADYFVNSNKNRYIHTASDIQEFKQFEQYISGGMYSEYFFYWATASRKVYPNISQPWLEGQYQAGSFPFTTIPGLEDHPGDFDPDTDEDGYVQMGEAFSYADKMDTWSNDGYYYKPYTSGIVESPQSMESIPFQEDLITLAGIAGYVSNSQTIINRNYLIGGDLIVENNANLTFANGGEYYLGNELANIKVQIGAYLTVQNDVDIWGFVANKIIIDGDISVGTNVDFFTDEGAEIEIVLNNNSIVTTFENSTFERVRFHNYSHFLTISNSTFIQYYRFMSHRGNLSILNTDFSSGTDQSWLSLQNDEENDNIVTVSQCTFIAENSLAAIDVFNYEKFFIDNNTIEGYTVGIQLWQAGVGNTGNQRVNNNVIYNCSYIGISTYNSTASIYENYVHNNLYGIRFINNSNIAFFGNPAATSYNEMNYITNNEKYELYFSKYSFPWYFRYNAIIDDDNIGNPSDPLLFFAYPISSKINMIDIRYNCWTQNNSFVASDDLYPHEYFIYSPTWCPNGSPVPIGLAEQMYLDGKEQFENQLYSNSKATFQLLIDQYPKTKYAESAMKELIRLEKFSTNDYSSLKEYFLTTDSIVLDTTLSNLATRLVNVCEIKLGNYQEAINFFEATIINPETLEDSIFAIIDLGYVYFMMENEDDKSNYSGQLIEFKPESKSQFFEHRDFLLSLIPEEKMSNTLKENIDILEAGELLQNIPNPFNGTTKIYYKLNAESNIKLNVYNYTGQLIKTYKEGTKTKGIHYIDFDAGGLKNGIYLYSISINGQITDSKKMTIMK